MIYLGADHGGYELKEAIKAHLQAQGIAYTDCGTHSEESVDYAPSEKATCEKLLADSDKSSLAVLCCGTGIGISMAANKFKGIRAALCGDVFSAKMAKEHNNANVICLGGRVTGRELANMIVDTFLEAEFQGGRHQNRIDKIHEIENM